MLGQEPPDGDFVAYVDELQRQSAARIHARGPAPMADAGASASPSRSEGKDAPALTRRQVEQMMARLAAERRARSPGPALALGLGIALIVAAIVFDLGTAALLIGVGLVIWSIARLGRSARARGDAAARAAQAKLAQVFGRPPEG